MRSTVTIATRGSKLALWQAEHIQGLLQNSVPGLDVRFNVIKTSGDKILDVPLAKVGGKGLFVKEIEEALLAGEADLAVHSMKDVPAEIPEDLVMGVVPERDDPTDCLLSPSASDLASLPAGCLVGTSSLRRRTQVLAARPDVRVEPLRGNLDTRVRKLEQGQFQAIVVASVGLKRLGLGGGLASRIEPMEFMPAVGQGALGIEYRRSDHELAELLRDLNHQESATAVTAERSYLHRLEGGCQVPIGGYAQIRDGQVDFRGFVADTEGRQMIVRSGTAPVDDAAGLGRRVAEQVLEAGGREILAEVYSMDLNPPGSGS